MLRTTILALAATTALGAAIALVPGAASAKDGHEGCKGAGTKAGVAISFCPGIGACAGPAYGGCWCNAGSARPMDRRCDGSISAIDLTATDYGPGPPRAGAIHWA